MIEAIKVDGLKQFNRDLKALDSDLPKAVRLALNQAADLVADGARPKVPQRSGKAARSIRAASTRTKARVTAGGKRAPHYPWLDFGGKVGRNRSVSRQFKNKGRYIYPTYHKLRDSGRFQDEMTEALIDVARKAGLEVD